MHDLKKKTESLLYKNDKNKQKKTLQIHYLQTDNK